MDDGNGEGTQEGGVGKEGEGHTMLEGAQGVGPVSTIGVTPELGTEEVLIEKTLLSLQEKVGRWSFV